MELLFELAAYLPFYLADWLLDYLINGYEILYIVLMRNYFFREPVDRRQQR